MESETENGSQATIGYRSRLIDLRSPNGDQMRERIAGKGLFCKRSGGQTLAGGIV